MAPADMKAAKNSPPTKSVLMAAAATAERTALPDKNLFMINPLLTC